MNKYLKFSVLLLIAVGLASCKLDMPKETESSFATMTVQKTNIEIPIKFSAKMKGQSDVTISPQVSGQLMRICVTEGQQVSAGQTLLSLTPVMLSTTCSRLRLRCSRLKPTFSRLKPVCNRLKPTCSRRRQRPIAPSLNMRATRTSLTRRL